MTSGRSVHPGYRWPISRRVRSSSRSDRSDPAGMIPIFVCGVSLVEPRPFLMDQSSGGSSSSNQYVYLCRARGTALRAERPFHGSTSSLRNHLPRAHLAPSLHPFDLSNTAVGRRRLAAANTLDLGSTRAVKCAAMPVRVLENG